MRKVIVRSVLAALVVVVFSAPARADLIPIGQLQWLDLEGLLTGVPAEGQFSIINQTGLNQTNDFPVLTALTFNAVTLDVTQSDSSHSIQTLGDFTDNGLSLDGNTLYLSPLLAELIGSVIPTGLVTLLSGTNAAWNGTWNILTGVLVPIPVVVNPGANPFFDTAIIYVEAEAVVPEPLTLTLVGTGLAGILIRRRRAARG